MSLECDTILETKKQVMKQKLNFVLLLVLLIVFPESLNSQETSIADKDEAIFNEYVSYIASFKTALLETILEKTARFFIGTPYVAHTLDGSMDEALVVNLRELDCVTFVENVLALSFAARSNNLTMDYYKERLTEIRYRNNEISDYASRLHYTSDWIFENQKNNLLENVSKQLSGLKETKRIDFMSSHRSAYKQLADDDAMLSKIVEIENSINNRGGFYYLPKELIAENAKEIPQMAVVGFVTSIDGLDTTHVGFAYHEKNGENGKLTFIHASSGKMEVEIDTKSLSDYCNSHKNCKGIIVAKVL